MDHGDIISLSPHFRSTASSFSRVGGEVTERHLVVGAQIERQPTWIRRQWSEAWIKQSAGA